MKKNKKPDPKYLGIPNICFSLTNIEDGREKEYKKQRIKRGFDDSELWSLDCTIADFILPRLKEFKKDYKRIVVDETHMIRDINRMIKAFKLVSRDDGSQIWNEKETKQYKKGIKVFAKRFGGLWT